MVNYIRIKEAADKLHVTRAGMYFIIDNLGLPTIEIMGITAIDEELLKSDLVANRRKSSKHNLNTNHLTSAK